MSMHQKKIYFSAYIGILLLYLKLFFIQPLFNFEGVDVTFALLLLFLVFIRVLFKLTILQVNVFGDNKSAKLFWSFVLISTISSFFLSPEIATGVVTANFQLFLIYLVFIDFKYVNINASGLRKIIKALVYFAIINALLVIYTFFFGKIGLVGEVSENASITRAFGLMGDQVAWFLSFFGIYALYNGKKYHYVLFLIAILMGASLGATLVLIIATLIYFIKEKRVQPMFYIKVGFSIVLFSIILLSSPTVFDKIGILKRIDKGDFSSTDSQTTGHRYNAVINAIDKISEKPFWGYQNYSLTMFNKYNNLLSDTEKGDLTYLTTPNNQILAIICDYGLVGLVLFAFFLYGMIKKIRVKSINIPADLNAFKQSAFIWILVFIVFNQSATWFLPGSFLWILICLIIGISYKINKIYVVR